MELRRIRSKEPVSFTVLMMRMQKRNTLLNILKCLATGRSMKMDGMQELFTGRHGTKSLMQPLTEDKWELYNSNEDFSLANDVASQNADKLKELQALFMSEGEKYHVLPIDDRLLKRTDAKAVGRPTVMGGRTSVTFGEGMKGMGVDIFINTRNKSYTITAEVDVAANGNGVIVCQGGRFGGFSFYVKGGKPAFTYNYLGLESYQYCFIAGIKTRQAYDRIRFQI